MFNGAFNVCPCLVIPPDISALVLDSEQIPMLHCKFGFAVSGFISRYAHEEEGIGAFLLFGADEVHSVIFELFRKDFLQFLCGESARFGDGHGERLLPCPYAKTYRQPKQNELYDDFRYKFIPLHVSSDIILMMSVTRSPSTVSAYW